jgi:hypothetical protein
LLAGGRVPSCFGQNRYYKIQLEYTDGTIIQTFDPVGGPVAEGEFGVWGNSTVYSKDQITYYSSKFWRSLANGNQGNEPGVDTGWAEIKFVEVYDPTVTYPINFVGQYNGAIYRSMQAGNLNKAPSAEPNWWQRVDSIPAWGTTATYAQYDLVIGSDGFIHVSQQNANLNHNPVGDSGAWWRPQWQEIPALIANYLSGGGALSAYRDNFLTDAGSYTLPLAASVPQYTKLVVSMLDTHKAFQPTITRSGADLIRRAAGTDTAILMDQAVKVSLTLVSNGTNEWMV